MTPEQIAAMIADRAAGTPGPWRVKVNSRDDQVTCDLTICGDIFQLADLNGPQYAHQHPNARRISRVPDMEATIIAQAAELAAMRAERDAMRAATIEKCAVLADDIARGLTDNEYYDMATGASDVAEAMRAMKGGA